jgi:glutathione synthase/RimK-type ligase-like ATP-grasp enzyme
MYDKLKNYIIVPNRRVIELSSDKYLCYLYMKEFMPKTELLSLFFEYPTLQEQFSNTIVLKPLDANGGNGIKFLSQEELLQHKDDYC